LNGVPMTDQIFKRHCYVVKQQDKHWPYLTAKETLTYAAELYEVADKSSISSLVDETLSKMGLDICADTRCARLSGGQKRRLSIAIALLKQPTLLFLDEPTSGLDAVRKYFFDESMQSELEILSTVSNPFSGVGRKHYARDYPRCKR
jgi:ABC-type multidrug transport system ATPase subunit